MAADSGRPTRYPWSSPRVQPRSSRRSMWVSMTRSLAPSANCLSMAISPGAASRELARCSSDLALSGAQAATG
eukprot:4595418-Lingulodinium_polyedra.AAC.1